MTVKCCLCLILLKHGKSKEVRDAEFVFNGNSLCARHCVEMMNEQHRDNEEMKKLLGDDDEERL